MRPARRFMHVLLSAALASLAGAVPAQTPLPGSGTGSGATTVADSAAPTPVDVADIPAQADVDQRLAERVLATTRTASAGTASPVAPVPPAAVITGFRLADIPARRQGARRGALGEALQIAEAGRGVLRRHQRRGEQGGQ